MPSVYVQNLKTRNGEKKSCVRVCYKDALGKKKFKQFQTKREALAWLYAGGPSKKNATATVDGANITFAQCSEEWITSDVTPANSSI